MATKATTATSQNRAFYVLTVDRRTTQLCKLHATICKVSYIVNILHHMCKIIMQIFTNAVLELVFTVDLESNIKEVGSE